MRKELGQNENGVVRGKSNGGTYHCILQRKTHGFRNALNSCACVCKVVQQRSENEANIHDFFLFVSLLLVGLLPVAHPYSLI